MDKMETSLLGIGLFAVAQIISNNTGKNKNVEAKNFRRSESAVGQDMSQEVKEDNASQVSQDNANVINSSVNQSGAVNQGGQMSQAAKQMMPKPMHNQGNKPNGNTSPGIPLNEFTSSRYKISFKYPRGWTKNPRYEDKYEGRSGFFEVGDFSGAGDTIDEAVNDQINEAYKPYGTNPTIRRFTVDGQPARVIYPDEDQSQFFNDREAAIVVRYPRPVTIDDIPFDYVVIWASREYIPLIMSTFKFIR